MAFILTYTGKRFDPEDILKTEVSILDIAHSLSNLCRFAGHTKFFYSVAQHSVLVSKILEQQGFDKEGCLLGLLHDATEAYLIDLPMPIKRLPMMDAYNDLEARMAQVIEATFNLKNASEFSYYVKTADIIALATEARDLMNNPKDWDSLNGIVPDSSKIHGYLPTQAKALFLERFIELGGRA